MRVKIGNEWHDAKDQAICIELNKGEQRNAMLDWMKP